MKIKDIQKMDKSERLKKIEEMKLELVKARIAASKSGSSKVREIKKAIARIFTLNNQNTGVETK